MLADVLGSRYGFQVERCEPSWPRGWTGETYVVTLAGGERVFAKVFPRQRMPLTVVPGLAVLDQLGLENVSHLRKNTDGALHDWLDGDVLVVFEYLDAVRVKADTADLERVGETVGRLHEADIRAEVQSETFEPTYAEELWRVLETARSGTPRSEGEAHLQGFVSRDWSRLEADWQGFQKVAQRCREQPPRLVITHGDWPFNLLKGEGEIYLVDWDDVLLAPAERDLWFPQRDARFDDGYLKQRQDYEPSELATAYYVYNRYFDDLLWSARAVLNKTVPAQHNPLTFFDNEWMNGMRARMI